jgi:hypothetical protein
MPLNTLLRRVLTWIAVTWPLLNGGQNVSGDTSVQIGYAVVSADTGEGVPVGSAILSVRNGNGVLVSRAGLAGVEPALVGWLFVDEVATRTAIAFVNAGPIDATAAVTLRDSYGYQIARQTQILQARGHLSRYVAELFPMIPDGFRGGLTFESNQPIAAVGLLESPNSYGESVYIPFSCIHLNTSNAAPTFFPQIAVGGAYSTQFILTNSTSASMRGQIRLTAQDGTPLELNVGSSRSSLIPYEVPPQGTLRLDLNNSSELVAGWGEIQPDPNSLTPMGIAFIQYRVNAQMVTGVCSPTIQSTTLARLFVDNAATRTGVAVANSSNSSQTLTISLLDLNGNMLSLKSRTLASHAQMALFVPELFSDLADDFNGVMEIRGTDSFVALALQLTTNSRNEVLLSTSPIADLTQPAPASVVFPQIVIGDQFSTRLMLINGDPTHAITGSVSSHKPDGSDLWLVYNGTSGSGFNYRIPVGAAQQISMSSPSNETLIYTNDFNGPRESIYPEWSIATYSWTGNQAGTVTPGAATERITNVDSYNSSQRFLGELGGPVILMNPPYDAQHFVRVDESVNLSLTNLPQHGMLTLTFDLYILKSWDGDNPIYGPDRWQAAVQGGPTLLSTTFSNNFKIGNDLSLQDYPSNNSAPQSGSVSRNSLGYGFWFGDSSYHMTFTFPHNSSSISIVFSSSMNEGKSEPVHSTRDESWGLDNVRLTAR